MGKGNALKHLALHEPCDGGFCGCIALEAVYIETTILRLANLLHCLHLADVFRQKFSSLMELYRNLVQICLRPHSQRADSSEWRLTNPLQYQTKAPIRCLNSLPTTSQACTRMVSRTQSCRLCTSSQMIAIGASKLFTGNNMRSSKRIRKSESFDHRS